MPMLILASTSPRRRELLAGLGVPFVIDPPEIDEAPPSEFAGREAIIGWVGGLARRKAEVVAARHGSEYWVLGADTIVVLDEEVLGKPADEAEAVAMLSRLQGRTHTVMTAVALVQGRTGRGRVEVVQTDVTFYPASPAELTAYVAAGESLDKAGAYAAQGRGALIIERINGCYFNVVGLPIATVARMLQAVGIDVWATVADGSEAVG